MQTILSGKFGFLICLIFPLLILAGLFVQYTVSNLRRELDMAKYVLERGPVEEAPKPPPADELLTGYTLLTRQDYEEIRESILKDLPQSNHG